jgi:SAM-dependent methyltransferase
MVLHGELARLRPVPAALTEYYLYISLGGALGGLLAGVAAPLLLPSTLELEAALLLTPVLSALALARDPVVQEALRFRRFAWPTVGAIIAVLGFVLVRNAVIEIRGYQRLERNFYGTKKIRDTGAVTEKDAVRKLIHGSINHGVQWRDPARAREPLTYYCPASGVGLTLTSHHVDRPRTLGFIGLGAGTLASYGKPGDKLVFFEIDPLVARLAREEFTYLSSCPANVEVVLGDARLSLETRPPEGFDVLAVDAFSGDAIPVHLLTREAVALYMRHLAPDGVLAIHVSNRHLDLAPVVADAAAAVGRAALLVESEEDEEPGWCLEAHWVLLVPEAQANDKAFRGAKRIAPRPGLRPWTDVYSNLLAVLK